jgi:hypothetical protein
MIKGVTSIKEVLVEVPNKVGVLAQLTEALSAKKVNILAITTATSGSQAWIQLVTENNALALKVVASLGWKASERAAVRVALTNKAGATEAVGATLASADINIESLYGSAWDEKAPSVVVVPSDVTGALKVLKAAIV